MLPFDAITGSSSREDARAMTFDAAGRLVVLDFVQDDCGDPPTLCNRYRLSRLTGTSVTSYPIQAVGPDFAEDVAVDPDGQVVVAGYDEQFRLSVARFLGTNPGTLDTTFSGDGVRVLDVAAASGANVVAMAGRRIVLGGFSRASFSHDGQTGRWLILKLRPDGSVDPAFGGGDGLVHFRPQGMYGGIRDLALDGSGRILAAGTVRSCADQTEACRANERPAVARFLADGTLDTSFGIDGFAVLPTWVRNRTGAFNGVAWDPRGWIVAGGVSALEGTVVRLTPRGRPDRGFAADGTFHVDPYPDAGGTFPHATMNEIVVRPTGAILAAGWSRAFGGFKSALWKLRGGAGPS